MLKFELGWLTRDDFRNVVIQTWQQECRGNTLLERWQNKIRRLHQFLRGWAKNKSGHYKKEKKELISMLDQLDKKSENERLEGWEIDLNQTLKTRLVQLLREEEIKWYKQGKTTKILQGDMNTKYFHLIANGEKIIRGDDELKKYITEYYRGLFGPSDASLLSLDESRKDDIPQVSVAEKQGLIASFSFEEVREAVF